MNPLFEEIVEVQNHSVKQALRDSTRQELHKMINNMIAFEYKYPRSSIGEETVEVRNSKCDTSSKGNDQTIVAQNDKRYDCL